MISERQTSPDIDALIEKCRSGDSAARIDAMFELVAADAHHAVPDILPLLEAEDAGVRETTAHVLGQLGEEHIEQIGPLLTVRLSDLDEGVRNQAAEAFCLLPYPAARPELERVLLHDPYWVARASAAEALGNLGDPQALGALEQALEDEPIPFDPMPSTPLASSAMPLSCR